MKVKIFFVDRTKYIYTGVNKVKFETKHVFITYNDEYDHEEYSLSDIAYVEVDGFIEYVDPKFMTKEGIKEWKELKGAVIYD